MFCPEVGWELQWSYAWNYNKVICLYMIYFVGNLIVEETLNCVKVNIDKRNSLTGNNFSLSFCWNIKYIFCWGSSVIDKIFIHDMKCHFQWSEKDIQMHKIE